MLPSLLLCAVMSQDFKFAPTDKVVTTASGLQYADSPAGKGDAVTAGRLAIVNYVLKLDDGKEIDSSKSEGRGPFSFFVGKGEVIKGWDEGLLGMKVGGMRKLRIPPELGYGEKGAGGVIPGGAVLWFSVDLLAITDVAAFASTEKVERMNNGLQYVDLISGKGAAMNDAEDVSVNYTVYNEKQEKLDASAKRGRPLQFRIGDKGLIKGFQEGVNGMKIGGIRKLRVPPELAYGAEGNGPVKPSETLWFILELVKSKK